MRYDNARLIFIPTDYSEQNIQFRYKKDLVGQLGNLVSRSASNTLNPKLLIPQNPNNNSSNSDDLALRDKLQSLPGKYLIPACLNDHIYV